MSSFLRDLPCRNPNNFTRLHTTNAIHRTIIQPTYSAQLDVNVKEMINDPIPLIIHRLSRSIKNENEITFFTIDQKTIPLD